MRDEFAVLFSAFEIEHDDAVELLETIHDEDPVVDGVAIPIRASIGIAVRDRATTSLEELLAAADDEMYVQKRTRRLEDLGTRIL